MILSMALDLARPGWAGLTNTIKIVYNRGVIEWSLSKGYPLLTGARIKNNITTR